MKTALITGATAGIGEVAARELALSGMRVVLLGRDPSRLDASVARIRALAPSAAVETLVCDLSSLAAVRRAAAEYLERFDRLDVLLNNAGAINTRRKLSKDGFELTFAVNHLAHFVLTLELLPLLQRSAPSRIVNVSSEASRSPFGKVDLADLQTERLYFGFKSYCRSKFANLLFTFELARRLPEGVTANALHPGAIASNFAQNSWWAGLLWKAASPFLLSSEKGARTSIWLASSPDVQGISGKYFERCRERKPPPGSLDADLARGLWEASERLAEGALGKSAA
jgi:NAD(P)-dependent dehydrogenase (short-subunit alcohol dehydrogenase family)